MLIHDPKKRYSIKDLILNYEEIFNDDIYISPARTHSVRGVAYKKNYNYDILNPIIDFTNLINEKLPYVNMIEDDIIHIYKITNLYMNKTNDIINIELLVSTWFIIYQFIVSDIDYMICDILPIVNNHYNTNIIDKDIVIKCYNILIDIEFAL